MAPTPPEQLTNPLDFNGSENWTTLAQLACQPFPSHVTSDYMEMAFLALLVASGLPLNLYVLKKLLKELRLTPLDSLKAGFVLMKLNLNISDLLLLSIFCVPQLIWLATYEWIAGNLLCKLTKFLQTLSFYVSSNLTVAISLDRLLCVLSADSIKENVVSACFQQAVIEKVLIYPT